MTHRRRIEVEAPDVTDRRSRLHTERQGPAVHPRRSPAASLHEAEERYAAARDAWTAAMQTASSGRPADLAALAMAQEAYETALLEVDAWRSGTRVAIEVRVEERGLDAIVGQELAWRRLHEAEQRKRPGLLGRLARRLSGRG